jgi:hypothetical protein
MEHDAAFEYTFIETTDREAFDRYVELRRRAYFNEYLWLPANFGLEDEMDRVSRIVVAMRAGVVAGGARLTISTPECPRLLPLEEAAFSLRHCDSLKDLNLERTPYGEISRMAADPQCARGFAVSSGLGNALCARAAREGLDVVFSICPEKPARINQFNAKRRGAGFRKYQQLPTVFGVDMWLCAFTGLRQLYGTAEKEAA